MKNMPFQLKHIEDIDVADLIMGYINRLHKQMAVEKLGDRKTVHIIDKIWQSG